MSTKISGNVSFVCTACRHPHAIDSEAIEFAEDTSPEAEEDEYIRYVSSLEKLCQSCSNPLSVQFDVWEFPEGAVNYSYYAQVGLAKVQCEFNLEYCSQENPDFTEEITIDEESESKQAGEDEKELQGGPPQTDESPQYNESQTTDEYRDEYDNED